MPRSQSWRSWISSNHRQLDGLTSRCRSEARWWRIRKAISSWLATTTFTMSPCQGSTFLVPTGSPSLAHQVSMPPKAVVRHNDQHQAAQERTCAPSHSVSHPGMDAIEYLQGTGATIPASASKHLSICAFTQNGVDLILPPRVSPWHQQLAQDHSAAAGFPFAWQ